MMASGYFVNVVPKNPKEDIVARRDRSGGREPKPRSRMRDHWYVRTLFNNLSPLLLLAMLALGALGSAVYVGLNVFSDEVSVAGARTDAASGDSFVPLKPRQAGDFIIGEDLSYGEALHAAKFGDCRPTLPTCVKVCEIGGGQPTGVSNFAHFELVVGVRFSTATVARSRRRFQRDRPCRLRLRYGLVSSILKCGLWRYTH